MREKGEFKINTYLTLRQDKVGKTVIYVAGKMFRHCKHLLINVPVERVSDFDEIESIDAVAENVNNSLEAFHTRKQLSYIYSIPSDVEFWGHCSNLQVWYENGYKSRLLHSNLAFPLLRQLTKVGDPQAKIVFKEEIAKRYNSGTNSVRKYLRSKFYLDILTEEEYYSLIKKDKERDAIEELKKESLRTDNFDIDIKGGNIIRLRLQTQQLKEVPYHIRDLSSLEYLSLSYNLLQELPEWTGEFQNLKVFEVTDNALEKLPDSIGELKTLEILKIRKNRLKEIPESLGKLQSLKILELYQNEIEELPDSFGNLSNLEFLDLHKNNLRCLPETIGRLSNLRKLVLRENSLKAIPDSIVNLQNLRKLYLGNNNIKSLPRSIGHLNNLETLSITNNPIFKLPESLYFSKKLRELYIGNTRLKKNLILKDDFKSNLLNIYDY